MNIFLVWVDLEYYMGHTYTKISFIIYLQLEVNKESSIFTR